MDIELLKDIGKGQEDWAFCIGTQAFIWGLPIIECWKDRLKKMSSLTAGEKSVYRNRFRHVRNLSTPESSEFVNAATDFLYSTAVLDLSEGPLKLTSPDFEGRWYGLQLLDPSMETIANLGTRTFGDKLPTFIIATREQQVDIPEGSHLIVTDSSFVFIVGRLAAGFSEDLTPVHSLQDQLSLQSLEGHQVQTTSDDRLTSNPIAPLRLPESDCPPELGFFEELGAVLKFVPPKADERMLLGLFKEIGISPEKGFEHQLLSDGVRVGLTRAIPHAQSILARKVYEVGELINGWSLVRNIGNYQYNYVIRALVSLHGIWANIPEESLYFMARTDSEGNLLNGNHNYEIRFEKEQTPPVDAFWSISYYDDKGRLTANALDKYTVNSLYSDLQKHSDGSISVFIGKQLNQAGMEENWLPSHDGFFNLNLRCYNPKSALLSSNYQLPPINKLD